ncbi:unnamed protein product [Sympodiomycopsis kandeliae]
MSKSYGTHRETGDPVRRQAQYDAALKGGMKGGALGLGAGLPTAYLLNRSWAPFRNLTLPLKAFFVTAVTLSSGVIAADKAGIAFERGGYSDQGARLERKTLSREEQQWQDLSIADKALTWTKENKFSVVAGSWVASLGGSFAYIQYQPLSFAQKLVQARVYAQGLTLASLLGMAAITSIPSAGDKIIEEHNHASDHSWKEMIGEMDKQQQQKQQQQQQQQQQGSNSKSNSKSSSPKETKKED